MQRGDCKKFLTAPLNAIIIIIIKLLKNEISRKTGAVAVSARNEN